MIQGSLYRVQTSGICPKARLYVPMFMWENVVIVVVTVTVRLCTTNHVVDVKSDRCPGKPFHFVHVNVS